MYKIYFESKFKLPARLVNKTYKTHDDAQIAARFYMNKWASITGFSIKEISQDEDKIVLIRQIFKLYRESPPLIASKPNWEPMEFDRLYDKDSRQLSDYLKSLEKALSPC